MNRINEALASKVVLAPVSVASATETTTDYISGAGVAEIEFNIALASLPDTKTLTIALYAADDAAGTNAVKVGEKIITASGAQTKLLAIVSALVAGDRKPYYGVKFQHNAGAAVLCSATAHSTPVYYPAANDFVLNL